MKLQLGFAGERYIYLPVDIIEQAKSHPMTQGLYIKFLGHFINAKFHYINRPKGCDDYIMLYCRDGKGWVNISNEEYQIEKNTFIILPPNIPHSYGANNSDPLSIYWIHFQGENAHKLSNPYYKPSELTISTTSRIEERLGVFDEIYQILSLGQSMDYFCYANNLFIHFLYTIIYIKIYRHNLSLHSY